MMKTLTVKQLCKALQEFDEASTVLVARPDYVGFRLEPVGLLELEFVTEWDDLKDRCRLADDEEKSAGMAIVIY